MNILLIHVSKNWHGRIYKEYPLGIGILGTLLSNEGHKIKIFDMAVEDIAIEDVIDSFKPEIIGLSFLSTSIWTAQELIKKLKVINCGILISGGIHTSLFPLEMLGYGIDVAVIGEAELTIVKLISYLELIKKGTKDYSILEEIPGLVFKLGNGKIIHTKKQIESVEIEKLPFINRDLFNLKKYSYHSIISSRGCIYNCNFCCSWGPGGKKGRHCSPSRIVSEIKYLVNKYDFSDLYFSDDMFFFTEKKRINFCELMIAEGFKINWYIQLRPDTVNDHLIYLLKKAGCQKIAIGAESGSDFVLKKINKKITKEKIEAGINCAVRNKMRVKTWWIIGLPGTNLERELETLEVIKKCRPNEVAIHTFIPLPGSRFWNEATKLGITLPSADTIEENYYYSDPSTIRLNYLNSGDMTNILKHFVNTLENLGYKSTDKCKNDSEYIYTSPFQKLTFAV